MRDLKTEVRELVILGKKSGKLTKMEILESFRSFKISDDHMKRFCERLAGENIEIIDDIRNADAKLDLETGEHYWNIITPEMVEFVLKKTNILTPKGEEVIKFRYGLADGKNHKRSETANAFGISEERVAVLERKIMDKLGVNQYIRRLRRRRRLPLD